jgi:hypothetical protein
VGLEKEETEMDKVEAVRRALAELGDVAAEELAAFAREHYGVWVDAKFVPVFKAVLKEMQLRAAFLQSRSAAATPAEGTVAAE